MLRGLMWKVVNNNSLQPPFLLGKTHLNDFGVRVGSEQVGSKVRGLGCWT